MKIVCLGGGPAGLYFAICMKLKDARHEVVVVERNKPDDTFGWGVVLSDEALENLVINDHVSAKEIKSHFAYWDDIAVHFRGTQMVSGGHGFCGIGRKQLLIILQKRARELGVDLQFETQAKPAGEYAKQYDLVVASDGLNSQVRTQFEDKFIPDIDMRKCKFVWLGTHQKFDDAFTFIFKDTEHGWVWAHAYQFDEETATFIIECSQQTYDNFGFDNMSQEQSVKTCQEIFADHLGGHELMSNAAHIRGSAWINFPRVNCQKWHYKNIVLMGDAAATGHFSIGSGSRLAFDSAISLANLLHEQPDMKSAFERYQKDRRLEVLRLQSAARNSLEWFEDIERYVNLDPVQFNYSLLTRSQRISHENLRLRDANWVQTAEKWFQNAAGATSKKTRSPMFAPFKLRNMKLANRVVVSPMAQYKATNGNPDDWHLVHYGERAKGGAGLIITEMTCISPQARITPGCTGLYNENHLTGWQRIVDFIHRETEARICCQLGHSGPKGSTRIGWEGMDQPLDKDNWPLLAASQIAWSEQNQTPKAMDRADMDMIIDQFVNSTKMADLAGFDMIELHFAHGYLLSSFISPLTNKRDDEYGGNLENRMRFPLEVCGAVRKAWPAGKPISVRISANDWVGQDGVTPDEAVKIAAMLKAADIDICDVSSGQTSTKAKPVYGRMYQTPMSDKIRQEASMATMAVGNIYEADHVNSILMAGRADLVCLARPHLADPYWTLHAAVGLNDTQAVWPKPYLAGAEQAYRLAERAEIAQIRV